MQLPEYSYLTLRFLQDIIEGTKKCIFQQKCFAPHIPYTPEYGVLKIWPQAIQHPEFASYIPDEWYVRKRVDRKFFYFVLYTIAPNFLLDLIADIEAKKKLR